MSKVRVAAFSVSLDGYGAGPRQRREEPLGENGESLHDWIVSTDSFRSMYGKGSGTKGPDNDFAIRAMDNLGAWIMGRNMFGPVRGPWPDESWKGWWGENPPYHVPVFVLTHHPRPPLTMKGDTTFYFVTEGIHVAMERAREAAGPKDIRIGGGTSVIRQYFQAQLIDEAHLVVSPTILGDGESLFAGLDLRALGYRVTETVTSPGALHVVLTRS